MGTLPSPSAQCVWSRLGSGHSSTLAAWREAEMRARLATRPTRPARRGTRTAVTPDPLTLSQGLKQLCLSSNPFSFGVCALALSVIRVKSFARLVRETRGGKRVQGLSMSWMAGWLDGGDSLYIGLSTFACPAVFITAGAQRLIQILGSPREEGDYDYFVLHRKSAIFFSTSSLRSVLCILRNRHLPDMTSH